MKSNKDTRSEHYELLFYLILKPYIFNMHTVREHQNRYTKEEK